MRGTLGLGCGLSAFVVVVALAMPVAGQSRDEVRAAQAALNALGHDAGPADGLMGPRTREAIEAWERETGRVPDGILDPADVAALTAAPTADSTTPRATPTLAGERAGARAVSTTRRLPGGQRPPSAIAARRHAEVPNTSAQRTPFGQVAPGTAGVPVEPTRAATADGAASEPDLWAEDTAPKGRPQTETWPAEPWGSENQEDGSWGASSEAGPLEVMLGDLRGVGFPAWFTKERFALFLFGLVVLSFALQRIARRRPEPMPARKATGRR